MAAETLAPASNMSERAQGQRQPRRCDHARIAPTV